MPAEQSTGGTWDVLVFAANDTTPVLPYDWKIDAITQASRAGVTFLVYLDQTDSTPADIRPKSAPFDPGAQLLRIENGKVTVVQKLGELDSGSAKTLGWFIATALGMSTADHHALVMSDHGSSWQGVDFDDDLDADGFPTRKGSSIDAAELQQALRAGLRKAGVDRLDAVIFDACLMASYEVAAHIAPYARYMMASEEIMYTYPFDFGSFTTFSDQKRSFEQHFSAIANAFVQNFDQLGMADLASTQSFSLIDLNQIRGLDTALKSFITTAASELENDPLRFYDAARDAYEVGNLDAAGGGFVDLESLLESLGPDVPKNLANARTALMSAVDKAIVSAIGPAVENGAAGMSIYFPQNRTSYDPRYDELAAGRDWRGFLGAYYDAMAAAGEEAGTPQFTDQGKVDVSAEGKYTFSAPVNVAAEFGAQVSLQLGIPLQSGEVAFLKEIEGTIHNGAAEASTLMQSFVPSDGTNAAPVFTVYYEEGGEYHFLMTFALTTAEGTTSNLIWDTTADGKSSFFTVDSSGAYADYTPSAGDRAAPLVLVQSADATTRRFAPQKTALDPTLPWKLQLLKFHPGDLVHAELVLSSFEGLLVDVTGGNLELE
jgi:hypothetical protein